MFSISKQNASIIVIDLNEIDESIDLFSLKLLSLHRVPAPVSRLRGLRRG